MTTCILFIKVHMDVLAFVSALLVSTLLSYFLYQHYVAPASIARKLRQHSLYVLPYRPFTGNTSDIQRLQANALLSHLPSPAAHREVVARIQPFYTKILSESKERTFVQWWGRKPRLVSTDPEEAKHILSVDFKGYSKSDTLRKGFHRLLGYGLLLAEGADWHNQRTMLRPAFFSNNLKAMVGDMHLAALQLTEKWHAIVVSSPQHSAEVEVASDLKVATAEIIARTFFGSNYQAGKAVFEDQDKLLVLLHRDGLANAIIPGYRYLPTPNNFECWKMERKIRKELSRIVHARLATKTEESAAAPQTHDLLSIMLASKGSSHDEFQVAVKSGTIPLTTDQIIDECKTFFFAGHETTAHLLTWTMMLLSLNQDWQEKLRDEAFDVCRRPGPYPDVAAPDTEQLNKLKFMGMVLNESLRLYPPVPELSSRVPSKDSSERRGSHGTEGEAGGGGWRITQLGAIQGMQFSIPVLLIHRDTLLWGDDAHEFRPERFAEGASKAASHPFAFFPFSFGPRACIGQSFALLEAKITLLAILQRFRFRLSPTYKHAPVSVITMKPQYGMQIIMELLA